MKSYEELHNELIEELKGLTTPDNIEQIQKINSSIQNMAEAHKSVKEENVKIKDKIVNMVNGTFTQEKPIDENERPKTLDEIMLNQLDKFKGGK